MKYPVKLTAGDTRHGTDACGQPVSFGAALREGDRVDDRLVADAPPGVVVRHGDDLWVERDSLAATAQRLRIEGWMRAYGGGLS